MKKKNHPEYIFIPEQAFRKEEESDVAEFSGSLAAGLAHMGGAHGLATALHLMEMMEPIVQAQMPRPNMHQSRALQYIQNAQIVHTPQGAGSNPGVWLKWEQAEKMGLTPLIPDPMFGKPFDAPTLAPALEAEGVEERLSSRRIKKDDDPRPMHLRPLNGKNDKDSILYKLKEKRSEQQKRPKSNRSYS